MSPRKPWMRVKVPSGTRSRESEGLFLDDLKRDFDFSFGGCSVEDRSQRFRGATLFADYAAEVAFIDAQLVQRGFIVMLLGDRNGRRVGHEILSKEDDEALQRCITTHRGFGY